MEPSRTKVIGCEVLMREILPFMPPGMEHEALDVGLHVNPQSLKRALQESIEHSADTIETIILGYGLCSRAVEGLGSARSTIVVPRMGDCIGILLSSREAHQTEVLREPGTYYLTRGWIDAGKHLFEEYNYMEKRFGPEKARRLMDTMLKHYTRLAFVRTGQEGDIDRYLEYCDRTAQRFGLRLEEIAGSVALMEKMIFGPWDEEFVLVQPGQAVTYEGWFRDPKPRVSSVLVLT
jgi:hypothetical protein